VVGGTVGEGGRGGHLEIGLRPDRSRRRGVAAPRLLAPEFGLRLALLLAAHLCGRAGSESAALADDSRTGSSPPPPPSLALSGHAASLTPY